MRSVTRDSSPRIQYDGTRWKESLTGYCETLTRTVIGGRDYTDTHLIQRDDEDCRVLESCESKGHCKATMDIVRTVSPIDLSFTEPLWNYPGLRYEDSHSRDNMRV